jgi:hypothetical protein
VPAQRRLDVELRLDLQLSRREASGGAHVVPMMPMTPLPTVAPAPPSLLTRARHRLAKMALAVRMRFTSV